MTLPVLEGHPGWGHPGGGGRGGQAISAGSQGCSRDPHSRLHEEGITVKDKFLDKVTGTGVARRAAVQMQQSRNAAASGDRHGQGTVSKRAGRDRLDVRHPEPSQSQGSRTFSRTPAQHTGPGHRFAATTHRAHRSTAVLPWKLQAASPYQWGDSGYGKGPRINNHKE